jgi:hypothetical protein
MNDADVEFEISMFQYERCGATCAFEEETRDGFVRSLWRRETARNRAFRERRPHHRRGNRPGRRFHLRRRSRLRDTDSRERRTSSCSENEFVTRQHAGSVKANNGRFSLLGEHAAFAIAGDEEDGNCNGHASAATDLFGTSSWQPGEGAKSLSTAMVAKKSMMAKEM